MLFLKISGKDTFFPHAFFLRLFFSFGFALSSFELLLSKTVWNENA